MKRLGRRVSAAIIAVVPVVAASINAPAVAPLCEVNGAIHSEKAVVLLGYEVEINSGLGGQSWHAEITSAGQFHLSGLPAGTYLLRVKDSYGAAVQEEMVDVHDGSYIDLQLSHTGHPQPGGTVSLRELEHPPARKAVAAAMEGAKLARAGDIPRAVEQLQKAIRISPDYGAAHSSLGVQYLRLKEYQPARVEINKALEIRGRNAQDLCNLAYLEAVEGNYTQAVDSARASLRENPSFTGGQFLLGSLLVSNQATAAEGIRYLQQAAPAVPAAQKLLDRVSPTP
jgi:tetratricopeptide (TPR) repeat protein